MTGFRIRLWRLKDKTAMRTGSLTSETRIIAVFGIKYVRTETAMISFCLLLYDIVCNGACLRSTTMIAPSLPFLFGHKQKIKDEI